MTDPCPATGGPHHGPIERSDAAAGWRATCACGARSLLFPTDEMLAAGLVIEVVGTMTWSR